MILLVEDDAPNSRAVTLALKTAAKDGGKAIIDEKAVFLQKPFNLTALIMAVERVLSKSK